MIHLKKQETLSQTNWDITVTLYHDYVAWVVLDGPKKSQNDHNDVEEVDHDGSPLVAQEVERLPLHCCYLSRQQKQSSGTTQTLSKQNLWLLHPIIIIITLMCVVKATRPRGTKHAAGGVLWGHGGRGQGGKQGWRGTKVGAALHCVRLPLLFIHIPYYKEQVKLCSINKYWHLIKLTTCQSHSSSIQNSKKLSILLVA